MRSIVAPAAARIGVDLADAQIEALSSLAGELLAWNQRVNLTSITEPREVAIRHVLDSLTVVPALRETLSPPLIVDIGSGGGFPGLPIAIALPDAQITLIDATAKKVAFLQHAIEKLGLPNARAIHSTAEELGRAPDHRGSYDVAIVRAVGSVATLVELLVPLLQVGGRAILMKTRSAIDAEMLAASKALEELHVSVDRLVDVDPSDLLPDRALAILTKIAETPDRFPRRPGVPRRHPLKCASS